MILLTAIAASAQPVPAQGFHCTIDSIRNPGAAEQPVIEEPERFFPLAGLAHDGRRYVLEEVRETLHTESFATHTIDGATGAYAATTWHTDHALGEHYRIETTGACERQP